MNSGRYRKAAAPALLVLSLLAASCIGNTAPTADVDRAELLATLPILQIDIERPVQSEIGVNDGSTDDLWPESHVSASRSWDTNGTSEHDLLVKITRIAGELGWTNLTAECGRFGTIRINGQRTIESGDGVPFAGAVLIAASEGSGDVAPYILLSVSALRATADETDPLPLGAPPVDWGCLYDTANP